VSRSTVENQDVTGPFFRFATAKPLRVKDPRSLPRGQIKILPFPAPFYILHSAFFLLPSPYSSPS
jgi:hypothetical protein